MTTEELVRTMVDEVLVPFRARFPGADVQVRVRMEEQPNAPVPMSHTHIVGVVGHGAEFSPKAAIQCTSPGITVAESRERLAGLRELLLSIPRPGLHNLAKPRETDEEPSFSVESDADLKEFLVPVLTEIAHRRRWSILLDSRQNFGIFGGMHQREWIRPALTPA